MGARSYEPEYCNRSNKREDFKDGVDFIAGENSTDEKDNCFNQKDNYFNQKIITLAALDFAVIKFDSKFVLD